jgi:hypothetical protein
MNTVAAVFFTFALITNVLTFEVAQTREQKEQGMMDRKTWGKIDGMVFVNREPRRVSYWMKDTYLPMAICYMDSNCNLMEWYWPRTLSTDLVTSSNTNVMYVLEIPPSRTNMLFSEWESFRPKLRNALSGLSKDDAGD